MPTHYITDSLKAQMRKKEGNHHHRPHIHVAYQNFKAVFFLDGTLDKGRMPVQQTAEVREWLRNNHKKLLNEWKMLRREENAEG